MDIYLIIHDYADRLTITTEREKTDKKDQENSEKNGNLNLIESVND
jgi:hypothetical protein